MATHTCLVLLFYVVGSINISNILTGKCLVKITAANGGGPDVSQHCSSSSGSRSCKKQSRMQMRSTVAEALEDITALFYDEERNEIYTGNRHGLVHVWSNWGGEHIMPQCHVRHRSMEAWKAEVPYIARPFHTDIPWYAVIVALYYDFPTLRTARVRYSLGSLEDGWDRKCLSVVKLGSNLRVVTCVAFLILFWV